MGKRTGGLLCVLLLALLPAGCQFIRIEEGERTPLEYTIVKQEEIPEEISELMEQKKKKVFQMTYQVGDIRYLMKGYGEQLTGGYSIQVEEVSESENAVFCKTRLIGPEKAPAQRCCMQRWRCSCRPWRPVLCPSSPFCWWKG